MLTQLPSLCALSTCLTSLKSDFLSLKWGSVPVLLITRLNGIVKGKRLAECPVHAEVPSYLRLRFSPFQLLRVDCGL